MRKIDENRESYASSRMGLPELPVPETGYYYSPEHGENRNTAFTSEQMRKYAEECILARLQTVRRWNIRPSWHVRDGVDFLVDPDGEWVRFEDIK